MAEIEEIPIADAPESVPMAEETTTPPVAPAAAPKKRGRPKGSTNKPKAAASAAPSASAVVSAPPKAKRTPKRAVTPEESSEEDPPPRKRRARVEDRSPDSVSPERDTRASAERGSTAAIAAEVLHLLSNRHVERNAAKREKYRSWFQ